MFQQCIFNFKTSIKVIEVLAVLLNPAHAHYDIFPSSEPSSSAAQLVDKLRSSCPKLSHETRSTYGDMTNT